MTEEEVEEGEEADCLFWLPEKEQEVVLKAAA